MRKLGRTKCDEDFCIASKNERERCGKIKSSFFVRTSIHKHIKYLLKRNMFCMWDGL